jgi:DNA polymerase III delta prime subunit
MNPMSKIAILIIVIILVAGFFFVFVTGGDEATEVFEVSNPWLEVNEGVVNELEPGDSGSVIRALFTGDELSAGATVATNASSTANIYFPDGSQLRLEPDTTVVLDETFFDPETGTLVARTGLKSGQVWSKVISLVTPESQWEVKSNNAVATVRGTAFGFAYDGDESSIIGSEDRIFISAVDPATDEVIVGTEAEITTDEIIELDKEEVEELVKAPKVVEAASLQDTTEFDNWVVRQQVVDEEVNQVIETIRAEVDNEEEVRTKFRESIQNRFKEDIIRRREALEAEATAREQNAQINLLDIESVQPDLNGDDVDDVPESDPVSSEIDRVQVLPRVNLDTNLEAQIIDIIPETHVEIEPDPEPEPTITAVEIAPKGNIGSVASGDIVEFTTLIIMSDGEVIEGTDRVRWSGTGSFGEMVRPGAFRVKYESIQPTSLVHDLGNIQATIIDENGKAISGASDSLGLRVQIPQELLDQAISDPSFSGLELDSVDFVGSLR